jgi:hypothetical protein
MQNIEKEKLPTAPRAPFFIFQEIQTPYIKKDLMERGVLPSDSQYGYMYQESIMKDWRELQRGETEAARNKKATIEQIASEETARYKSEMEIYVAQKKAEPQLQSQQQKQSPVDILKMFEKELADIQCAICTDYFQSPVTLPCQHTFCKKCLIKNKIIGGDRYTRVVTCSQCRQQHNIDLNTYQEDKIIMSLLKYVLGPEEYNNIQNRVDPEEAARKLYKWYTENPSETCMIVDDCIQGATQQFLNSNHTLLLNLDNFMNEVFGDNISALAGFPLGNLKYYHLRRLMRSEVGSQIKFISIRDVTILVNMKNFTINWISIVTNPNTPLEQKELYHLLRFWVDNDGRGQDLEEYFYSKLPKNVKEFNVALYDRAKNDPSHFALDFFISEISKIIANPINYIPFAEILELKLK